MVTGTPDADLLAGAIESGASAVVRKADMAEELPAAVMAA